MSKRADSGRTFLSRTGVPGTARGFVYPFSMSATRDPQPSGGQHRAADTDPVRRWDDNFFRLWLNLEIGQFGLRAVAVLAGLVAVVTAGIMLWPGASIGASDAAVYALIAISGLYGLLWLTTFVGSLLLSVTSSVVSLARFLRHR